ncbi:hypothetical protein SASPL_155230 [Salvia splendens]|uniref:Kinesin motor domain-containing protein n=1 Tax=Salvia splendens TaxID=180675 RepID=A0A8X8W1S1_SALSN|nr:hypothetical protein SASPL_155230 [Salvia splendens]
MSRTLWSSNESPTKDFFRSNDEQKGVNVQVVARCRPLSEEESRGRASSMISCDEIKQQVIATQNTGNKQTDKVFVFDKVFGPNSKQIENGEFHENAGVIPRAVQQIFDVLERERADYSMKATFLELYNEEITDLLAPDEGKRPLVLMEDGKGAVFVRGLEEEVNQKLMKSTVIKDLYSLIDSLKQELRVSRQVNGGYGDRHSSDALRKQLMELQELYLYQQQLTVDLKDKLLSTERELTMARQSLFNLKNQCQQAEDMCRDKEAVIFNLISSGKELTKKTSELQSDLEGAVLDVSTLFAKIEHKTDLEETNRQNVESFYSQLVQQLQELDEGVSASATSQEQNWKATQDDTRLFLTSKAKIENLKELNTSGVNKIDGSVEELYQNSLLALSRLSSVLSDHSSCIMDLVSKNASAADAINNGLKSNMKNLGLKLDEFVKQQKEIYTSKLTLIEEDSQTIAKQKLHAFTTKFEEYSAAEEKLLLEQMSELLANSSSRKKKMIQAAVDDVLESASSNGLKLNQEIAEMQSLTVDTEEKWNVFTQTTESNYVEDSGAVEAGKCTLEDGLQCCMRELAEVSKQQRLSEESLLDEIEENSDSQDSLTKNETAANEKFHDRFSSIAESFLEDTDDATRNLTLSAEKDLRLDREASEKAELLSARCIVSTKQASDGHSGQVTEISISARKCLVDDYLVDSSSSPRKRNMVLQSREEIESLISLETPKADNAVAT